MHPPAFPVDARRCNRRLGSFNLSYRADPAARFNIKKLNQIAGSPARTPMNNGNLETSPSTRSGASTQGLAAAVDDAELSRLKRELLQAEVRLAKARATVVGAEVDIKVVGARLRALTK